MMTSGQYTIATNCDTEVHYHAAGLLCLCREVLFVFRTIVQNSAFEIHGFAYLDHLPSPGTAVHAHSQTWVLHGQDSRVQGISEPCEALVV